MSWLGCWWIYILIRDPEERRQAAGIIKDLFLNGCHVITARGPEDRLMIYYLDFIEGPGLN